MGAAARLLRERPVVVLARGHSGTRLLAWALAALGISLGTRDEVATGDVQDRRFADTIRRLACGRVGRAPAELVEALAVWRFRRAVGSYFRGAGEPPVWGWKFPETYLIPEIVDAVFPDARYLHLLRDGRDVAFKVHDTDNPRKRVGRTVLAHVGALDREHHLQAALSWQYQVERFRAAAPLLRGPLHEIRFEDLCRHPEATMAAVAAFLDLPMTDSCRTFLREAVRPEKVAEHREAAPARVREVEERIGETLRREGYPRRAKSHPPPEQ